MFGAYVYEISSAEYEKNVLLIDFSIALKSKGR